MSINVLQFWAFCVFRSDMYDDHAALADVSSHFNIDFNHRNSLDSRLCPKEITFSFPFSDALLLNNRFCVKQKKSYAVILTSPPSPPLTPVDLGPG